jgi:hypothetical protein
MFYVGQKVVCVDDGNLGFRSEVFHPGSESKAGDVYVVRDVGVTFNGWPGLKLQGKKLSGWNSLVGGRFDDFFTPPSASALSSPNPPTPAWRSFAKSWIGRRSRTQPKLGSRSNEYPPRPRTIH